MLYLIEILHQTTTDSPVRDSCFVVVSYRNSTSNHNCFADIFRRTMVVSYRNSPSNHNSLFRLLLFAPLYLIEILHQTTTSPAASLPAVCCILSKFYIKPQLHIIHRLQPRVVSYRNSTSNHNRASPVRRTTGLYLIEILHQTTTISILCVLITLLYLIEILHQTTTSASARRANVALYLIEILHQTTTVIYQELI